MDSIPSDLYTRLQTTLVKCGPFGSNTSLNALFVNKSIASWHNKLPGADSPVERVQAIIEFLHDKSNNNGENALIAFMRVLMDQISDPACHADLEDLISKLTQPVGISDDNNIMFVNRIIELNQVVLSVSPVQHWAVDAPSGFGKTQFLLECKKRYTMEGWACAYVAISRYAPEKISALANQIIKALGAQTMCEAGINTKEMGRHIAARLLSPDIFAEEQAPGLLGAKFQGAAIFIDNIEATDDQTLSELADLINSVFEGLSETAFFANRNRLRFFLAGRYIHKSSSVLRNKNLFVTELSLSPYTFAVIQEAVRMYASNAGVPLADNTLPNIAAELMYLNGGHPGCTASFLKEQSKQHFVMALFSLQGNSGSSVAHVNAVLDDLNKYGKDVCQLIPVLETLSAFRYYDTWLLKELIEKKHIAWKEDCYRLEEALLGAYLLQRKGGFLQDGITRRLFAIHLRLKDFGQFQSICREGEAMYRQRLETGALKHPEKFAVEYMYQHLQYAYYVENVRGEDLKKNIQDTLMYILNILIQRFGEPHETEHDFFEILAQDWELEFTTNYMLKDKTYTSKFYNILQAVRKAFQAQYQSIQR